MQDLDDAALARLMRDEFVTVDRPVRTSARRRCRCLT
jgi:hypothetical protein